MAKVQDPQLEVVEHAEMAERPHRPEPGADVVDASDHRGKSRDQVEARKQHQQGEPDDAGAVDQHVGEDGRQHRSRDGAAQGDGIDHPAGRARLPGRLRRRAADRRALLGALDVRARARGADGRRRRAIPRRGRRDRRGLSCGRRQPGLRAGLGSARAGRRARQGLHRRDPSGFGLWAEQLLAESTGKEGKGLVPAPASRPRGLTASAARCGRRSLRPRRGVLPLGVRDGGRRAHARDQPVRPARRAGGQGQDERGAAARRARRRAARLARRAARRGRGRATTSASRRSSTRRARPSWSRSLARAHETGCVVTHGLGPRFLHSTGQLHKGGPEHRPLRPGRGRRRRRAPIPGRDFGFGRLIRAQAAGDFAALEERGRRVNPDPTGGHLDEDRAWSASAGWARG